jgi:hypothetical protein
MNEEEKKAIEFLKENLLDYEEIDTSILLDINEKHKIILNLIERLQKENEEWQRAYQKEKDEQFDLLIRIKGNYISIQKVKDKLKEYKDTLKTCNKAKDIDRIKAINERILELQELLESEE